MKSKVQSPKSKGPKADESVNLAVQIGKLRLQNPVMVASRSSPDGWARGWVGQGPLRTRYATLSPILWRRSSAEASELDLTIRFPMPKTHSPGLIPALSAGLPGTVSRTSIPSRP